MSESGGRTRLSVWSALLLILLTHCITPVDGAAFASMEPCPEGVAPGETWLPDTVPGSPGASAGCMSCTCFENRQGYGCQSCGVYAIQDSGEGCYVIKLDPTAPYPECCAIQQRCPGDVDYDPDHATVHIG